MTDVNLQKIRPVCTVTDIAVTITAATIATARDLWMNAMRVGVEMEAWVAPLWRAVSTRCNVTSVTSEILLLLSIP